MEEKTLLKKKKAKNPRKTNPRKRKNLSTKIIGATAFVIVMVALETAWQWVPTGISLPKDTAITAGILDNIPYAVVLFLLIPYQNIVFKLASLVWLIVESGDGLMRVIMLYAYYTGGEQAAWAISNSLSLAGWLYFFIPLLWLWMIHKNFLSRPTASYSPLNTYLFFRKPKNVRDILISLTGAPTSHVAVVYRGQYYFFKRGLKGYRKQLVRFSVLKQGRLVKINPPPDFGKMLDIKLGSDYRLISNNCVTILKGTGIPVGKLDFFPAVFMMRYL